MQSELLRNFRYFDSKLFCCISFEYFRQGDAKHIPLARCALETGPCSLMACLGVSSVKRILKYYSQKFVATQADSANTTKKQVADNYNESKTLATAIELELDQLRGQIETMNRSIQELPAVRGGAAAATALPGAYDRNLSKGLCLIGGVTWRIRSASLTRNVTMYPVCRQRITVIRRVGSTDECV